MIWKYESIPDINCLGATKIYISDNKDILICQFTWWGGHMEGLNLHFSCYFIILSKIKID